MKIKNFHKSILLTVLTGLIVQTTQAFIVYDPTNWIQNSITATNSSKSLVEEVQQVKLALQNIKNYDGNAGQWANIQNLLQKLGDEVQQGQSLSYTMQNIDSKFQTQFPGYKAPQDYQQSYSQWSQTSLDTLRGTLDSVGLQADQFANEQASINALSSLSKTAQGRMQALQVGNMIATQQLTQTQQLRQLVMTQVNAENVYAAAKVQKDAANEAAVSQWINNSDTTIPKYGESSQKNQGR